MTAFGRAPAAAGSARAGRAVLAEVAAGILGTALLLWLLRHVLFPPVTRTFGHDFVFWYPVWQFYAEGLALGELRLWNPLSYGGVPLYPALLQLRVFDPISFLVIAIGHRLTPDLLALYNWDVFLRAWLPAVAAHVFLRRFADHAITRIALIVIVLWSSFLLVMLRMPGASQGFLWAPFIAILLHRIVWRGAGGWREWLGLGVFVGLNGQSYFWAPHLTFIAVFVAGIGLFHPGRIVRLLRTPGLASRVAAAALVTLVMLIPLIGVLPEGVEVLYLPRMLDTSRARGDVGPMQYEPIPSPTVREVGLFMPPEFFASNGTPATIWNFLQLVSPTGNWHREGGHGWGNPEESFMYLGLPVYAVALLGLLGGHHPLRRPWMLLLTVFGLLLLGPLGGAQSFLAWTLPLVRFIRHTHTYTPYFQLALLFFFVLGCNRLLPALLRRPAPPREPEPAPRRWLGRIGLAAGAVFIVHLLAVETPTAFRFFSTGKAVTPAAVAVGLVLAWWLWRRVGSVRLFWILLVGHLLAVPVLLSLTVRAGLHTAPAEGLAAALGWLLAYWALFLGLPIFLWWRAPAPSGRLRLAPRATLVALFALLVADQIYYASYTDYLWSWPRPDRVLGVNAEATPLRYHPTRGLYPSQVERSLRFGQAVRYPELLLREPNLLTAPRGPEALALEAGAGAEPAARLQSLRGAQRWNSFYVPRRYFSLLHSETPAPVLARLWALDGPAIRFVPRYLVVPDGEVGHFFRVAGASRTQCLLARAAVLPLEPTGMAGLAGLSASSDQLLKVRPERASDEATIPVKVTHYTAGRIELEIVAPRPGLVVLSDTFHPRWSARVDGNTAPVLRANYLLKAVPVPAGPHRVVLDFEPDALLPALAVFTVLGLGGLAGAIAAGAAGLIREMRDAGAENH
jgi:hypothetical protein